MADSRAETSDLLFTVYTHRCHGRQDDNSAPLGNLSLHAVVCV